MSTFTAKDGTSIYYKDWGTGPIVTFSHGWPLSADAWDAQMLFLGQHGYRVIAHDRRGHGRSGQTWQGNDMDQYADDLADLMEHLGLKGVRSVRIGKSIEIDFDGADEKQLHEICHDLLSNPVVEDYKLEILS